MATNGPYQGQPFLINADFELYDDIARFRAYYDELLPGPVDDAAQPFGIDVNDEVNTSIVGVGKTSFDATPDLITSGWDTYLPSSYVTPPWDVFGFQINPAIELAAGGTGNTTRESWGVVGA
jgi:hypothetical protein